MPPGPRSTFPSAPSQDVSHKKGTTARARHWPLPDNERMFPKEGGAGSFWEDRGDRHHAGLDLYAAPGSRVVAIESGIVLSSGIFTSPDLVPYWNVTYQITIAHNSGIVCRYAELGDLAVKTGDRVVGGEVIGHVGEVLDLSEVGAGSPPYIRALKDQRRSGMLHLEVFTSVPGPDPRYQGGNWFTSKRPSFLLDPALVLRDSA